MKKITPSPPETPAVSAVFDSIQQTISTRLRDPHQRDPISHVFTILPEVGTGTLLTHASETLASLNVLTTDLASELDGSRRSLGLSIQQLALLGELLINRALDNLDLPDASVETDPGNHP